MLLPLFLFFQTNQPSMPPRVRTHTRASPHNKQRSCLFQGACRVIDHPCGHIILCRSVTEAKYACLLLVSTCNILQPAVLSCLLGVRDTYRYCNSDVTYRYNSLFSLLRVVAESATNSAATYISSNVIYLFTTIIRSGIHEEAQFCNNRRSGARLL